MGRGIRYTEEFKQEAVNQVVVHGYPVLEVSQRLGVTNKSLYDWIKKYDKPKLNAMKTKICQQRLLVQSVNSNV